MLTSLPSFIHSLALFLPFFPSFPLSPYSSSYPPHLPILRVSLGILFSSLLEILLSLRSFFLISLPRCITRLGSPSSFFPSPTLPFLIFSTLLLSSAPPYSLWHTAQLAPSSWLYLLPAFLLDQPGHTVRFVLRVSSFPFLSLLLPLTLLPLPSSPLPCSQPGHTVRLTAWVAHRLVFFLPLSPLLPSPSSSLLLSSYFLPSWRLFLLILKNG